MKCGLLGGKLGHSYSPQIHAILGSYSYGLYECSSENLEAFIKNTDLAGFNVTIPHKKAVIPFLDELTPIASRLGAVNTVIRRADGTWLGHNTDYFGFYSLVKSSGIEPKGKKVLVLGTGGASNTVCAVMKEMGANVTVISRSGKNNYSNIELHKDAAIIVNATPVGMYPNTMQSPVDLKLFPDLEGVLDVVYNPQKTKLILDAEQRGVPCQSGLMMLVAQAKEAAEYFTGNPISDDVMPAIYASLRQQMLNIILIGMPGCGKTTIGSLLAKKTGRKLEDADTHIVLNAGKTIPEIFRESGEACFRDWETRILSSLGSESGKIISTGGGCVTQERNYPHLHQNGIIIWLLRNLEQLPTDGRPISQSNKLSDLFAQRYPLYEAFSDIIIDNNGTPEETVQKILACWEGIS